MSKCAECVDLLTHLGQGTMDHLTSEVLLLRGNSFSICTAVGYNLHCVPLGSDVVHVVQDSTLTCKG